MGDPVRLAKRLASSAGAYLVAIAATATALLLRRLLDPALGDRSPLSTIYGAVAVAVWFGGYGPALVSALLGYLAADYLFMPPRGAFGTTGGDAIALVLYVVSCLAIVGLGQGTRRARRPFEGRLAEARDERHRLLEEIAERVRVEKALSEKEAALRGKVDELETLLDILPGGVLRADPECRRISGNRAFYDMLGLAYGGNASLTAEQPDLPSGTRVLRDGRPLAQDDFPMQAIGRTGRRIRDFDHDLVFPDGRRVTLLANTAPLLDESGHVRARAAPGSTGPGSSSLAARWSRRRAMAGPRTSTRTTSRSASQPT